jgi:hypothetical protein
MEETAWYKDLVIVNTMQGAKKTIKHGSVAG